MTIFVPLEEDQREIARSVERFAAARAGEALANEAAGLFPREAWRGLAELGVLALGTPEGAFGVEEIATAMHVLGRASFPGPLVATFVAARLLADEDRAGLVAGNLVVAVGKPPLMSWATHADRFLAMEAGRARLAVPSGPVTPATTLAGEPWGRLGLETTKDLGDASAACAVGDVALAAYLVGAGGKLIDAATEHARTRKQFGRAIGEFQAVAHPLAISAVGLRAADALVLSAARRGAPPALAAAARLSAVRAALHAASTAPQIFGALGVLAEGPVFAVARRIRQWASEPTEHVRAREEVLTSLPGENRP